MSELESYKIEWIPLKSLSVVWRKAQRPYDEKWANHIADGFDPEKFEPIIVTRPNGAGIYHIVEGQHRKAAAEKALGADQSAPCRVVGEADPARAAEIWLGINKGRKAPRPVTEFMISVEAKREVETAINSIVKKAEYRVMENSNGENVVSAVGALRKVYGTYGATVLLHTLQACRLMWGSDPHGVSGKLITGVGMFINEFYNQLDANHLRKAIVNQYKSPWKFIDAARVEAEKSSETLDLAMSELIRMQYNKGVREGGKLKRKEK
jgi:hypothetical protein